MRKKDLTYINIDSVGDVITNADIEDIPSKYAIDARGVRLGRGGMVIERQRGTKLIYDTYPTVPTTVNLVGGFRFYNKDNNTEYDVIITADPSTNYTRVYIYDSAWIEITRTFTAQVNATPSASATQVVVKTVKDALGAAYNSGTFVNDDVDYWICYNVTQNKTVLITSNVGNTLNTPNILGSNGAGFTTNDYLVFFRNSWTFNNFYKTTGWSSPASGTDINLSLGATPHNRWLEVEAQKKVDLALGNSSIPPTMTNLMRIQDSSAKPLFYGGSSYLLTVPATWDAETIGGIGTFTATPKGSYGSPITTTLTGETVTILNDTGVSGVAGSPFMQIIYNVTHTATPGSKEVNLRMAVTLEYDGYQESDPVYKGFFQCPADFIPAIALQYVTINPATMPKHLTAINFYIAHHDNSVTAAQWLDSDNDYVLNYNFPINFTQYNALGVLTSYSGASVRWILFGADVYCYYLVLSTYVNLGTGAVFSVGDITTSAQGLGYHANDVLTLVGGSGDATATVIAVSGVTGQIASIALTTTGTSGYSTGIYTTTVSPAGGTGATINVTSVTVKYTTSSEGTLAGNLAHATDTNRSLVVPAYLVKTARNQAAIQVLAKDDSTLRMTCYDGSGVHEDDNLPDVTIDSSGNRQLIALNGKGLMKGIEISRDTIYVFRSTEAESFDLQTGAQSIFDIDFLAKDSLVKSPYGLTWAGRTGIWFMPENGSSIRQINLKWANQYNGELMIDDGITPFITDAYRTAIISGYDPYTKAVIFSYQINKHDTGSEYMTASYEFEKDSWSFKVLGGSTQAKFFTQTTRVSGNDSAKLIIGYSGGLLLYPNLTGNFPYTDLETAAGTIGSGYDTSVTINVRELYNQVQNANLVCFMIELQGASIDGAGMCMIELFANKETTAFDTQYVPVDDIGEFRFIEARGNIDSLRIRLSISGGSNNLKKLDVSRIVLGFKANTRIGNL